MTKSELLDALRGADGPSNELIIALNEMGFAIVPRDPPREVAFHGSNTLRNFNRYEQPGMAMFDAEMKRFDGDKTTVRAAHLYRAMVEKAALLSAIEEE